MKDETEQLKILLKTKQTVKQEIEALNEGIKNNIRGFMEGFKVKSSYDNPILSTIGKDYNEILIFADETSFLFLKALQESFYPDEMKIKGFARTDVFGTVVGTAILITLTFTIGDD